MITEKEYQKAKLFIEEYPIQDEFIMKKFQLTMYGGEPSDNSIGLHDYWMDEKRLVDDYEIQEYALNIVEEDDEVEKVMGIFKDGRTDFKNKLIKQIEGEQSLLSDEDSAEHNKYFYFLEMIKSI